MTHPHTAAIVRRDCCMACVREGSLAGGSFAACAGSWGIKIATIRAPARWIIHRTQGITAEGKNWETTPNRNAGPALLQKASILSAWDLVREPLLYAELTAWAPTGYPPKTPISSSDSAPAGMPYNRPRGFRKKRDCPERELVSIEEIIKKGNREGMTVRIQRSIPVLAPSTAVWLSRIRISIAPDARRAFHSCLGFTFLTSWKFMQERLYSFICW